MDSLHNAIPYGIILFIMYILYCFINSFIAIHGETRGLIEVKGHANHGETREVLFYIKKITFIYVCFDLTIGRGS